ncbi:Folate transporter 1 [Pteropus alecto]|uniref:Folate transporter 1 n=1 Tax=Pteropus alecto TaxID=9402 RepID=L5JX06_PTEAL|nr:Folate transporter 1 [Pteropus alecto]
MVPSGQAVEKPASPEPEPQSWRCLVFFLCFYGFLVQMRPGESFITPYLLGPSKNFTQKQARGMAWARAGRASGRQPGPSSYVSVWLLLLLGRSVGHMQLMEVFYSVTMAARIAYSSYVFSLVRPARYQRVAGYSRAAVLLGVFTSSVLGQLLVTVGRLSFTTLNYISLAFLVFSLLLTFFLKRPKRSLFFNRREPHGDRFSPSEVAQMHPGPGAPRAAWQDWVLVRMLRELAHSLRLPQLRLWSLWWVFNSAGYYLVVYYVHILWNAVNPTTDTTKVYNGGADAASTLLGAIASFAAGFVKLRWALWAKLVIGVVTAAQAGLVFLMYSTDSIWLCYAVFILFRGFYQFLVPIATFQIASSLSKELCALVFGVNTFLATVLKTAITLVVSDKRGLGLSVHSQVSPVSGDFQGGRRLDQGLRVPARPAASPSVGPRAQTYRGRGPRTGGRASPARYTGPTEHRRGNEAPSRDGRLSGHGSGEPRWPPPCWPALLLRGPDLRRVCPTPVGTVWPPHVARSPLEEASGSRPSTDLDSAVHLAREGPRLSLLGSGASKGPAAGREGLAAPRPGAGPPSHVLAPAPPMWRLHVGCIENTRRFSPAGFISESKRNSRSLRT